MEDLLFLQKLERSPARVDFVEDATALRYVQVRAAPRTQATAFLAAERFHRNRHLDALLRDWSDRHHRVAVEIGVEVLPFHLDLRLRNRPPRVEDERELLVVLEGIRR